MHCYIFQIADNPISRSRIEQKSIHYSMEASCTTINYLENFLLNSGPKQDCLVRICKYIDVLEMVNLSESSKHSELFMEFFKDRVIHLNSFDFMYLDLTKQKSEWFKKVFERFGPYMQKIKVRPFA